MCHQVANFRVAAAKSYCCASEHRIAGSQESMMLGHHHPLGRNVREGAAGPYELQSKLLKGGFYKGLYRGVL